MGAMPTRGLSAWDTLRSYLPNSHDLFKVAVAILILLAFYLLARLVRLLASQEVRRVKADPQVGLLVNRTRYPTRLFTLTAKVPGGVALDGLTEKLKEQVQSRPEIAKDPPPHIALQPSIDGGLTLEVRYWLDYRRNDPLAVQAAIGQQVYRALQSAEVSPKR